MDCVDLFVCIGGCDGDVVILVGEFDEDVCVFGGG